MEWNRFIGEYQFLVAWAVYLAASLVFCVVWWRLTSLVGFSVLRQLFRGFALVIIYTPWFVSDAHDYLAPALVVVAMDVLLGSSPNGLAAALALGGATLVMIIVLTARWLVSRKTLADAG